MMMKVEVNNNDGKVGKGTSAVLLAPFPTYHITPT